MAAVVGEPVVRQVVMDVVGVEEGDEDIHVEERGSGHESIDQSASTKGPRKNNRPNWMWHMCSGQDPNHRPAAR